MKRQILISICIIVLVFSLNSIAKQYTNSSVKNITSKLENLRESLNLLEDNISNEDVSKEIEEIINNWEDIFFKMSFYIEHSELEKFETDLISVKSFINSREYNEAISDLDKSIYVLEHIEEKYKFTIENIF